MLVDVEPEQSQLMTVKEVARKRRVAESTVYNWIANGVMRNGVLVRLESEPCGGTVRVSKEALRDFMRKSDRRTWRGVAEAQEVQRKQAKREQKRFRAELGNN